MTQRKHPVFSGFLAVVWLAIAVVSVNAANPSFNALVWTNSGGVITPIKSPTNVVRITSGLADNATNVALVVDTANFWTGDAALLSLGNGGTNRFLFGSDGSLSLLPQVGPSLTKLRMISEGGFIRSGMILPSIISGIEVDSHNNLFIGAQAGWSDDRSAVADAYVIGTSAATALIDADDVIAMDYYALNVATNAWYVQAIGNNALDGALGVTNVVAIGSNAGGNSLVYGRNHVIIGPNTLVDTELQEVTVVGANAQANGDNAIALGANAVANGLGDVSIGDSSNLFRVNTSASDGNPAYRLDTSITHTSGNLAEIANNGTNVFTFNYQGGAVFGDPNNTYFFLDRTPSYTKLYSVGSVAGDQILLTSSPVSNGIETYVAGISQMSLYPDAAANQTPYKFGTSVSHSSSNLVEITNNGTNEFTVAANSGYTGAGTLFLSDDGTYKSAGGGGTAGTVINTGTPVVGNVPYYTDTTGTNVAPSTSTLTFGNASVASFTNTFNLSGVDDPSLIATNNGFLFPSGTVSQPSMAFSADADGTGTGMYRLSANVIAFSCNGVFAAQFSSSGLDVTGPNRIGFGNSQAFQSESGATQMGADAATPATALLKGADGSGTDRPGGDMTLAAGKPTGTGTPGKLKGSVTATGTGTGSSLQSYTTAFALGGTLKVDTTTTGNVGSGEDDLISYTIPAGQLGSNGDYIEFDCFGTFGATVNTAQLKIYYDGTAFFDTTSLLFNGLAWKAHGKIVRTSATAQKITVEFTVGGTLLSAVNGTVTTYATDNATLSGTTVFKITGQDTGGAPADNKVVQEGMILKYYQGL